MLSILHRRKAHEIRNSALFDADFYLTVYPDVRRAHWDPALHYAVRGWRQNRNPSLAFNTARYLANHADVARSGTNPLLHYVRHGAKEGRRYAPVPAPSLNNDQPAASMLSPDPLRQHRAIGRHCMPKVSVVVPNYNHEPFLRQRLDSIFQQTYQPLEVILLDDCSTDESRLILDEYARRHPTVTRTIYNDENSGGVFRQWARGIKEASGDLIWIAESDDHCDRLMLETLAGCFDDEAVKLAYGKSVFVDRDNACLDYTFEGYIMDLEGAARWAGPYIATATDEVAFGLGIRNTIPNVSSVVFRRPEKLPLIEDEQWLRMRVAGDWIFYLHVIQGGAVAYCPQAINFYRRYTGSAAERTYKTESFYREVGRASATVAQLYDVPWKTLETCRDQFKNVYFSQIPDGNEDQFQKWYDYDRVAENAIARRQHTARVKF